MTTQEEKVPKFLGVYIYFQTLRSNMEVLYVKKTYSDRDLE